MGRKKNALFKKAVILTITTIFVVGTISPAVGLKSESIQLINKAGNSISNLLTKIVLKTNELIKDIKKINSNQIDKGHLIVEKFASDPEFRNLSPINFDDPWWNTDWPYRKMITINHTNVDGELTDFPVLIKTIDDSSLSSHAQVDGDDIVFTNKTGYKLAHEIEEYNIGDLVKVRWGRIGTITRGRVGLITEVKKSLIDEKGYLVFFDEKETFYMVHRELELVS